MSRKKIITLAFSDKDSYTDEYHKMKAIEKTSKTIFTPFQAVKIMKKVSRPVGSTVYYSSMPDMLESRPDNIDIQT